MNCAQVPKTNKKERFLHAIAAPQKGQFFEKTEKMEAKGSPNFANSLQWNAIGLAIHATIGIIVICQWKESKPDNYLSNQHPDSPPPPQGREVLHVKYLRIQLNYPTK